MKSAAVGLVAITFSVSLADTPPGGFASLPTCQAGSPSCVSSVIDEMQERYEALGCDHNAIFSLLYMRTTEKFLETLDTIGYADKLALVREDALFADYYFRAFDAYRVGAPVPEAWRIAFDASKNRTVSAYGNALLGVTAHIRRDQPFMLYELSKNGSAVSYQDHLLVNNFLNQVDVLGEVAALFDPTFDDLAYPVDPYLVEVWRQKAWNDYLQLRNAPTAAIRAEIAAQIEQAAAREAESIVARYAYAPGTSEERDDYCEAAH